MIATGTPTPRLRLITRSGNLILQQQHLVTFEPGSPKERSRWVWLDTPSATESKDEAAARAEVEALGSALILPKDQLIR